MAFMHHLWALTSLPPTSQSPVIIVLSPSCPHWPLVGSFHPHHPGLCSIWPYTQTFFLKLPKSPGCQLVPRLWLFYFLQITLHCWCSPGPFNGPFSVLLTPLLMASSKTIYCPRWSSFQTSLNISFCQTQHVPNQTSRLHSSSFSYISFLI